MVEPTPTERRRRLTFPRPPGTRSGQPPKDSGQSDANEGATLDSAQAFPADTEPLTRVSFQPARLPVKVAASAQLSVVVEPGAGGVTSPVHIAYDPSRLRVDRVDGGELGGERGPVAVTATHTPALGWVTLSWSGRALSAGTALRLTVSPLAPGELPVILAGPIGEIVSRPATVVALPELPLPAAEQ